MPAIAHFWAVPSRPNRDKGDRGQGGSPHLLETLGSPCRRLCLWAANLLAANSDKLTYLLSCLGGDIGTLIPNCLKALVVMHSHTGYKTMCSKGLCRLQLGGSGEVLPTPPLTVVWNGFFHSCCSFPERACKVEFRGRETALRGVSASLHLSTAIMYVKMKI